MKRKQIYILTALTLTFCTANAQKTYTLDDCRSMALQNNLKLKNSQLDVDMAIQGKKEAFTGYFPTISAGGTIFQGFNNLLQADMEMAQTKVPLSAIKKEPWHLLWPYSRFLPDSESSTGTSWHKSSMMQVCLKSR